MVRDVSKLKSTLGIIFAKDLISMGFYSIDDLLGKDGAELTDLHEKHIGYKTDPCVEDQFRLIVYFAKPRITPRTGGTLRQSERHLEQNLDTQRIDLKRIGLKYCKCKAGKGRTWIDHYSKRAIYIPLG